MVHRKEPEGLHQPDGGGTDLLGASGAQLSPKSPSRWLPTATRKQAAPQGSNGGPRGKQPSLKSLSSASTSKAPSNSWGPANSACHPVSLSLPGAASHCKQALALGHPTAGRQLHLVTCGSTCLV